MLVSNDTRHLHITFYLEPLENPAKSRAEGRPIFEDREMVEIKCVGDPRRSWSRRPMRNSPATAPPASG